MSTLEGPATGKDEDDEGNGSSEDEGSAGIFDQRFEWRHDRRESPGLDMALLTRRRILPALTRLRRLLRADDPRDSEPSEMYRARELSRLDSELGPAESTDICDSVVGVGVCADSKRLELLWPMAMRVERNIKSNMNA